MLFNLSKEVSSAMPCFQNFPSTSPPPLTFCKRPMPVDKVASKDCLICSPFALMAAEWSTPYSKITLGDVVTPEPQGVSRKRTLS